MKRKIYNIIVSEIISLLLVILVSIHACAEPAFFDDVPEPINGNTNEFSANAPWYTRAVFWLYHAHILDAAEITDDGYVLYGPNRDITREQFLAFLGRLAKEFGKKVTDAPLDRGETLDDFTKWALDNHILYGTEKGLEKEGLLTRQEMVVFMMRFADYMGVKLEESNSIKGYSKFIDLENVSSWAEESMKKAYSFNLIAGKKNRNGKYSLHPKKTATRAEAAQIVYNYVETSALHLPCYTEDIADQ